jgi:Flavin containing amine oxidoreductase
MTNHVIVGAGAAGLYTAYRLLKDGALAPGDTVKVFEWSDRPGGRIYTYTFPDSVYPPGQKPNGLYCEFGGMRFATDKDNFPGKPSEIKEGHVLVQQTILALGLQNKVVTFQQSDNRLYYLRGVNVYEKDLDSLWSLTGVPYKFNAEFTSFLKANVQPNPATRYTADTILGAIAAVFAPGLGSANADRAKWCDYYARGSVPDAVGTVSYPACTPVRDIGYWNLLYDQLGDEGFDYSSDGTGYTSNVINWNAADAMQANNDYGSNIAYNRLDGGYSLLFEALAAEIAGMATRYPGSGIFYGRRLTALKESSTENTTICTFVRHEGRETSTSTEAADTLFLAMPRRSLEMVAEGCGPDYMLNKESVKYLLESSIDQPAIKVVMIFDQAWWTTPNCKYRPNLIPPSVQPIPPPSQWVGGATITDLPLRMVYYFANNIPGGPGATGGPYVLLASYDDMNYSSFWRELELSGDYQEAPSRVRQPMTGPTSVPVTSPMAGILVKQLADVHGIPVGKVPTPTAIYFQDWGQDPFGGGYHGWSAHYDICRAMDCIRAPYQRVLGDSARRTYIIGSCYSFDQAWVEGAFCVAESVLRDFIHLDPFPPKNPKVPDYVLVCRGGCG